MIKKGRLQVANERTKVKKKICCRGQRLCFCLVQEGHLVDNTNNCSMHVEHAVKGLIPLNANHLHST